MIDPDPPGHEQGIEGAAGAAGPMPESIGVLRGAIAGGDTRRAARVGLGLVMLTLAGLAIGLIVGGIERNAHITDLHKHGVAVQVTVTGCRGLLGGSGSNFAGYSCQGTFLMNSHRYNEGIPGDALLVVGSKLKVTAVASDPGIIDTPAAVRAEHASLRVFLVPAMLLVVLGVLIAGLRVRRRSGRAEVVGGLGARGAASS